MMQSYEIHFTITIVFKDLYFMHAWCHLETNKASPLSDQATTMMKEVREMATIENSIGGFS